MRTTHSKEMSTPASIREVETTTTFLEESAKEARMSFSTSLRCAAQRFVLRWKTRQSPCASFNLLNSSAAWGLVLQMTNKEWLISSILEETNFRTLSFVSNWESLPSGFFVWTYSVSTRFSSVNNVSLSGYISPLMFIGQEVFSNAG